jgi:hypothetical protein
MKISNDKQHLACATSAGVKIYDLSHDADMANVNFPFRKNKLIESRKQISHILLM